MKRMKMKIGLFVLSIFCSCAAFAQENNDIKWYIGVGGGYHSSFMSFSNIDDKYFPTNKNMNSGLVSLFVQGEFGKQHQYAIRPQLSFLKRGGQLKEIGKKSSDYDYKKEINDINYTLKPYYIDIRLPLIYNFGKSDAVIRPYVYVAPVLGFVTGGDVTLLTEYKDDLPSLGNRDVVAGYKMDLSSSNMASSYFAGQVGLGVKFALPMVQDCMYIGVEANYEYGFTDTYGSKEKSGDAVDVLGNSMYKIDGTRKFSGFEFQATLSIPFSAFKKRSPVTPIVEVAPVVEEPVVEDKHCYSLDEIIDLMTHNQSVEGKTICSVDDITFDVAKSVINPNSYKYLDKLAETLIRTNKHIEVKGHTDNVGSDEFNMNLSRERAEAVVDYLLKKGVSRSKLTYSYYGMTRPLATNDTEEGRAINRRVEFSILNNF